MDSGLERAAMALCDAIVTIPNNAEGWNIANKRDDLRAALDAAQEPAQAGSFVCERGGCGKNGRVDPYGAGPDCKSGGLSPAGSEPATATTIKPSAGGA